MTREKAIWHFERYVNDDCYTIEYRDACRMAVIALREQGERRWIPVAERLPEKDETVIICTDKNFIYAGELIGDTWFLDNDSWTATVTHWMPMPKPPREVLENETL